ncbi:MAG: diguanylate cyclase [Candidatus Manganitrophus sp.]|nr:MAG: diguanylate cyclase [Candidatus Manganitrophus sp.]
MQRTLDLNRHKWEEIQHSLSSLTGLSLFIYDPSKHRPCTATTREHLLCHLVHQTERETLCQNAFAQQVDLAIQTQQISFSKCQANLNYFVIPIRLSNEMSYAMIGGKVYHHPDEYAHFKQNASEWGISSEKLPVAIDLSCLGAQEGLQQVASYLQVVATALLENIYRRGQYQGKAAHLTTLLNVGNQFKSVSNISILHSTLLNTLGILFNLKSACIFHQTKKQGAYRSVAVFGEKKERFNQLEASLDILFQKRSGGDPFVFNDVTFDLLKSKLPQDVTSCYLFPLYQGRNATSTLAIFDTILTSEETAMISSFCSQAGSAVENIELQNQLAEQRKIMIALSNLTLMIDSPLYLHHLHNNILEQTLQLLQAEQGSLMVLDEFKNELSVKAMKGINRPVYEMFNSKPGEGIAGSVYETGVPLLVQDLNHDPRVQQGAKPRYRTPSFVSVPLKLRNRTLGVINLADKITGEVFSEEDLQLLQAIGSYISIAIERSELYEKTEELKRISITDALTGLLNRRYFQERLTEEIERSRRHRIPVSLIIVDIDNFKGFNDTFGHLGGDEILILLGQALRNYIRAIDVAARYGGEEFTIILPQTNKEDARIIAERLCREIERNETLQKKYSDLARLTVSVGLATFPDDAETFEELIRNADRALYQAKLQGKNRVITFDNGLFS